jgi:succinyl-diaminopimelate desuccinylase
VRALGHLEVLREGNTIVARTNLGARSAWRSPGTSTRSDQRNVPTRDIEIDGEALIWGRGTVDMKAGVAVQLKLAAELTEPVVDITWMWYDNEEVEAARNGLKLLADRRPDLFQADFAILGEPSNGEVEGGCNGTLRAVVRTTGVRAHSARAWIGENAIHRAAPILARLAEYRPREIAVDVLYREGLNAVRISGGIAGNVIPDLCEVEVNYRFAPSKSAADAEAHVRNVFAGFAVEITDVAEGARPGLDAPIAQEFLAAVGATPQPKYGGPTSRASPRWASPPSTTDRRSASRAPRRGAGAARADHGHRAGPAFLAQRCLSSLQRRCRRAAATGPRWAARATPAPRPGSSRSTSERA